ncbi:MAG: DUF309 domain-containing protein [Planctomycetota bacterium]|nr:DUF309 domain-containing protein [Planctomycetota bacterium]
MSAAHQDLYVQGIELFNREKFFACHDVLEELWTDLVGDDKQFYQGLIHAAVCLFHFGEGNYGGALKMYRSCGRYLTPYGPSFMGLNVEQFLNDMESCFEELSTFRGGYPSGIELDATRIPKITLNLPTSHP